MEHVILVGAIETGKLCVGTVVLPLPSIADDPDAGLAQALAWSHDIVNLVAGHPVALDIAGLPRAVAAALVLRFGPEALERQGRWPDDLETAADDAEDDDRQAAEQTAQADDMASLPLGAQVDAYRQAIRSRQDCDAFGELRTTMQAARPDIDIDARLETVWLDECRRTVSRNAQPAELDSLRSLALSVFPGIGQRLDDTLATETAARERRTSALGRFAQCTTVEAVDRLETELRSHTDLALAPVAIAREAARRRRQLNARSSAGQTSAIRAGNVADHRLTALPESADWTLYVDETGEDFTSLAERGEGKAGWIVVVAVPKCVPLPGNVRHDQHAAHAPTADTDRAVQWVLDNPVGVLGFSARGGAAFRGANWREAVMQAVAIALRVLPMPAQQSCTVQVVIERRGDLGVVAWLVVASALQLDLAQWQPVRARMLTLSVLDVKKGHNVGLVIADAVAYTIGATLPDARDRRSRWGLQPCILDAAAVSSVRRALGAFGPDTWPSEEQWIDMLRQPDATDPKSIVGSLLQWLGSECKRSLPLWERYRRASMMSLEDKGFDVALLARQAEWLRQWTPQSWQPTAVQSLALGLHALAAGNRAGDIDKRMEAQLLEQAEQLRAEHARVACLAALHVAVRRTNRFAFSDATQAIQGWLRRPESEVGLQLYGRLLSSRGQHYAFQGQPSQARKDFDAALALFTKLSDPDESKGEQRQTAVYRALAALDETSLTVSQRREHLNAAGVALDPTNVQAMAAQGDDASRWRHHVLVRYLAELPGSQLPAVPAAAQAYLGAYAAWSSGSGHPWALIEAWRGVLCLRASERDKAKERFDRAIALCGETPAVGTIQLIGCAIKQAAWCAGLHAVPADVGNLRGLMPSAATSITRLTRFGVGADPADVLRRVLPFNFR